jgi:hypothetical protein
MAPNAKRAVTRSSGGGFDRLLVSARGDDDRRAIPYDVDRIRNDLQIDSTARMA